MSSIQSKDDTVSTVVEEIATTRFDAHVRTVLERYYTYIVESVIVRVTSSYCSLNERLRGQVKVLTYAVGSLSGDDLLIVLMADTFRNCYGLSRFHKQSILVAFLVGPGQISSPIGTLHGIVDPAKGHCCEVSLGNSKGVGIAGITVVDPYT